MWDELILKKKDAMNEDFNKLVEQYMMFDKKTLAELLAMKELANRMDIPTIPSYPSVPYPSNPYPNWPWYPGPGDYPWWPQVWYTTKTSDGKEYENWNPPKREGEFKCELNRHDVIRETDSNNPMAN